VFLLPHRAAPRRIARVLAAVTVVAGIAVFAALALRATPAQRSQEVLERAVADFLRGRIAESVAGFDQFVKIAPDVTPQLWQRGIALYYAGRYDDCRRQFELHRTVNPNDVENAAWHFLCVARAESPARARAALLPVGPDSRAPMRQIYQMFGGDLTPESVLQTAGTQAQSQFFARLYVGLYYEALGESSSAMQHLKAAASDRYADAGGYMHRVAVVHVTLRATREAS